MMIPDYGITRDRLKKVKFVAPENAGSRWRGAPHIETVETVAKHVKAATGCEIAAERFWCSKDGFDLAGCFDLLPKEKEIKKGFRPAGYLQSVGFVTSNSRRRALTLYAGFTAADESHGLAFTELGVCKNTENSEEAVERTLGEIAWGEYTERWEEMEQTELGRLAVAGQMVEACRRPFKTRFLWSKLGHVDAAHQRVQRDPKRRTALTMALAFAYVLPQIKPMFQMDVMTAILYKIPCGAKPLTKK